MEQQAVIALATGVCMIAGGVSWLLSKTPEYCDMCGGMGAWNCVICAGSGRLVEGTVRRECPACVGRGKRLCRKCGGTGIDKKTDYIG